MSTRELTDEQRKKVEKVMREFYAGKLYTSAGKKVTDKRQALAIAISEATSGS